MEPTIALVLLLAALASARAQDVDVRAADVGPKSGPDGSQAGGSRTAYVQRHLSPHRMMHFGKKAEGREAPSFLVALPGAGEPSLRALASPVYDLAGGHLAAAAARQLEQQQQQFSARDQSQLAGLPISLSLYLESGQELQSVPLGQSNDDQYQLVIRNPAALFPAGASRLGELASFGAGQSQSQSRPTLLRQVFQQPAQQAPPRFMRLRDDEQVEKQAADKLAAELAANDKEQVEDGEQQGGAISVSTRSMQQASRAANRINIPGFVSSLLYGRQGASSAAALPSYGVAYNKKAEPKDNFFMHFGRK